MLRTPRFPGEQARQAPSTDFPPEFPHFSISALGRTGKEGAPGSELLCRVTPGHQCGHDVPEGSPWGDGGAVGPIPGLPSPQSQPPSPKPGARGSLTYRPALPGVERRPWSSSTGSQASPIPTTPQQTAVPRAQAPSSPAWGGTAHSPLPREGSQTQQDSPQTAPYPGHPAPRLQLQERAQTTRSREPSW